MSEAEVEAMEVVRGKKKDRNPGIVFGLLGQSDQISNSSTLGKKRIKAQAPTYSISLHLASLSGVGIFMIFTLAHLV